jgi:hypothetical protein
LDLNNASDRTLLTTALNRLSPAQAARFPAPYPGFPMTSTLAQALRPFPQFGNITSMWSPVGNTWYDSLQAKITKRFSHGLDFSGAFTWQKELQLGTESAFNDIFSRDQNKFISSLSRPLVISMAGTYQLPRFARYKAVSMLFRQWRFGAVMMYSSGLPISVPQAQNSLNTLLMRTLPAGIASLSYANRVPGQPLFQKDLNCHCIDPNQDFVLNPAAWTNPAPGQFGSSPSYYNDYRFQRRPSESMSLERQFKLMERGLSLDIRVQFSNIFNRSTMADPTSTNAGQAQLYSKTTGLTSSGFGFVNPTVVPSSMRPREGLFIAKLRF